MALLDYLKGTHKMKMNFPRALIFLLAIFVLSIFLFSLNKNNVYDTKNLIGQKINSFVLKSLDNEFLLLAC